MTRSFLVGLLCLSLYGCDRICGDDSPANVAGSWEISGKGSCVEEMHTDTEVSFSVDAVLSIMQDGTSLALGNTVGGGTVGFSGSVDGACVDFTISETSSTSDLRYVFKGVVDGTRVHGDVTGNGDRLCSFQGDFEVSVDAPTSTVSVSPGAFRECQSSAECRTGEACEMGRCKEAVGCNCETAERSEGTLLMFLVLMGLGGLLRRQRASTPGSLGGLTKPVIVRRPLTRP